MGLQAHESVTETGRGFSRGFFQICNPDASRLKKLACISSHQLRRNAEEFFRSRMQPNYCHRLFLTITPRRNTCCLGAPGPDSGTWDSMYSTAPTCREN